MWAVGENCVAAIKFEISGFYSSGGQASAHLFCSGGRGLFNPRGGLFRSNFKSKNHHFSDDFPVIFWYIHMMLLN